MGEKFDALAAGDAATAMLEIYPSPHPAHLQAEELIRACEEIERLERQRDEALALLAEIDSAIDPEKLPWVMIAEGWLIRIQRLLATKGQP